MGSCVWPFQASGVMSALTTTVPFVLLSAGHILLGLSNLSGRAYKNILVNKRPGTGETPIEKVLASVFAGWYLASILPVILAKYYGSAAGLRAASLCPLFYHAVSTLACLFTLGQVEAFTDGINGPRVFHAVMTICSALVYHS